MLYYYWYSLSLYFVIVVSDIIESNILLDIIWYYSIGYKNGNVSQM
jgi:hypothetical protein